MYRPDYYNEEELTRYLKMQQKHAWDLQKDIAWDKGIDLSRPFVALDKNSILFPRATLQEKIVISQFMGLIINSTINELEKALERSRVQCWENLLRKYPVNPELWELGEEFFADEAKHSAAFERHLDIFASTVNVTQDELRSLLPAFDRSRIEGLFRVNGLVGGHAMWWVVAAVEEESILVYRHLKRYEKDIDPLYFDLHKKHFEEESRHAAYAFIMLDIYRKRANSPLSIMTKKLDFLFSEVMQVTWVFHQMLKGFNIRKYRDRHPFFEQLYRVLPMLTELTPLEIIHTLFTRAPYISLFLNPLSNKHVNEAVKQGNCYKIPRPGLFDVKDLSYYGVKKDQAV